MGHEPLKMHTGTDSPRTDRPIPRAAVSGRLGRFGSSYSRVERIWIEGSGLKITVRFTAYSQTPDLREFILYRNYGFVKNAAQALFLDRWIDSYFLNIQDRRSGFKDKK
jgi:hypothetical protein